LKRDPLLYSAKIIIIHTAQKILRIPCSVVAMNRAMM